MFQRWSTGGVFSILWSIRSMIRGIDTHFTKVLLLGEVMD